MTKIKTEKIWLSIGVGTSILIIYFTKFCPSPAATKSIYELGQVFFNLSLSYLASVIFYLIVVHFPEKRKMQNVNAHIAKELKYLTALDLFNSMFLTIKKEATEENLKSITKVEMGAICGQITLNTIYPEHVNADLTPVTYRQFLIRHSAGQKILIEKLASNPNIDSELLKLLYDILDCSYFHSLFNFTLSLPNQNDRGLPVDFIFPYYTKMIKLDNYFKSNLEDFGYSHQYVSDDVLGIGKKII